MGGTMGKYVQKTLITELMQHAASTPGVYTLCRVNCGPWAY
jgi:hypothetical protein